MPACASYPQSRTKAGTAKVGVDQDHVLARKCARSREAERHRRLPLASDPAGHKDCLHRLIVPRQSEAVTKDTKGLELQIALLCAVWLASQPRNARKRWQLVQLFEFLKRLDATIDEVEQEGEARSEQQTDDERDHSGGFRLRRAWRGRHAGRAHDLGVPGLYGLQEQQLLVEGAQVGAIGEVGGGKL